MSSNKVEIVKRESIIKIDVSSNAYYAIKNHTLSLIEELEDSKALFIKVTDEPDKLEGHEYTLKILLDIIAEVERTAVANKQVETIEIVVEDSKDPS